LDFGAVEPVFRSAHANAFEEHVMRLSRREIVLAAGGAAAFQAVPRLARAATYPDHPVRVIVAFGAGGPGDVFARLMAEKFSQHFGQQFFVENIVGAGGNIGTEKAAKSPPDGYTILVNANNHIINPLLYEMVPYDPVKDFAPVSLVAGFPTAFSVNTAAVPAKTVAELVALVRATPGKFSYASSGVGTPSHLLGERFRQALNLDIVHVPYSGTGPATQAVLAGDTQIGFAGLTAAAPLVPTGKIRVLATMSRTRSPALPDVPTIIEAGYPGLDGEAWEGIFVPAGTPQDIITLLNEQTRAVLAIPEVKQHIETLGFTVVGSTPDAFARQMSEETQVWAKVIKAAGLKLK
jgi:tripartite-type tricarboxylate transporter receptor subunit TctC